MWVLLWLRNWKRPGRNGLWASPKFQRVDLFNYNVLVRNYDSSAFKGDRYHNTKNGINADIGASTDLDDNWTLGLVAQNLIPRSIETKEVNGITETFRIRPQVTAGVSWHNAMFTTAFVSAPVI